MSNYRKIWEDHNKCKLLENQEIHHIDGNHFNNDISNLLAVTLEEHLKIHLDQEDYGAVQAIIMRMARTTELTELIKLAASKHQKKLLELGRHNFQKMTKEERCEVSRKVGLKTLELGIGIHAINADPERSIENARKGGLAAAAKKAGFLNTEASHHGSKAVKGTKWWVNINGDRKRSVESPGYEWKRGMKYEGNIN